MIKFRDLRHSSKILQLFCQLRRSLRFLRTLRRRDLYELRSHSEKPKITSVLAKRATRNYKLGCYVHNFIIWIHIWKQYNHSNNKPVSNCLQIQVWIQGASM